MTKPLTPYEREMLAYLPPELAGDDSEPDWVKRARLYLRTGYHRWAVAEIRAWERAWALNAKRRQDTTVIQGGVS